MDNYYDTPGKFGLAEDDWYRVHFDAKIAALRQHFKSYYLSCLEDSSATARGICEKFGFTCPEDVYLVLEASLKRGRKGESAFLWLTVNVKDEQETAALHRATVEIKKYKWCEGLLYTVERSSNGHPHAHILLKRTPSARPAYVVRLLRGKFRFLTDVDNKHTFCARWIPDDKVGQKEEYIRGKKQAKKAVNIVLENDWRRRMCIPAVRYESYGTFDTGPSGSGPSEGEEEITCVDDAPEATQSYSPAHTEDVGGSEGEEVEPEQQRPPVDLDLRRGEYRKKQRRDRIVLG